MDLNLHVRTCSPGPKAMEKFMEDFGVIEHTCEDCFQIFDSNKSLDEHKSADHNTGVNLVCEICHDSLKNIASYCDHLKEFKKKSNHGTFKCEDCGKEYLDKKDYWRCRWNHSIAVRELTCPICQLKMHIDHFGYHLESLHCDEVVIHYFR